MLDKNISGQKQEIKKRKKSSKHYIRNYLQQKTNKQKKLIKEGGNIWQRNQEKREKTDIIIS